MKAEIEIARYIGAREDSAEAGYEVFLDLLGHVIASVGEGIDKAGEILMRLGIELPGDLLSMVSRDLRGRVRILDPVEISHLQEMLLEIILDPRRIDKELLISSMKHVARISSILAGDLAEGAKDLVVGDLFVEGGLIIKSIISSLGPERISMVWGFGANPLASLATYASLIDSVGVERISIVARDPFSEIYRSLASGKAWEKYRSDIVLLHPLLLYSDKISGETLQEVYSVLAMLGYGGHVIKRRLRLSEASMLLADSLLREGGALIAITPAYILYDLPSRGVRRLLQDLYSVAAIVIGPIPTFSGKKALKGAVILARKARAFRRETLMIRIDRVAGEKQLDILGHGDLGGLHASRVNLRSLWNPVQSLWIHFFSLNSHDRWFVEILTDLMDSGELVELRSVASDIAVRRGVSINALDFFILPNRYWGLRFRDSMYAVIFNREDLAELEIDNKYLLPIITKPRSKQNQYSRLVVQPTCYILSIPPIKPSRIGGGVAKYIDWGVRSGVAEPAIRILGSRWYSYAYKEISSKKPASDLFAPRAMWSSIKNQGVSALMTEKPAIAGNGFYALVGGDRGLRSMLAVWLNSTFFLYIFARIGRILNHRWGMLTSDDFLSLPAPRITDRRVLRDAEKIVEEFSSDPLPPLHVQLSRGHRVRDEIDSLVSWLLGLGEDEVIGIRRRLLEILP